MGNVFATHTASDEDTIIYLKSKDTGKFWHSNSREGEGFKFSKTKNTSTAWIIEWNSGDISVGSIINLKSVANGGYLHSNMDEDEDEGVSWGERDADYAWTIYFGYDDAAAAPRSAAPNQRAVDALAHSTGSLLISPARSSSHGLRPTTPPVTISFRRAFYVYTCHPISRADTWTRSRPRSSKIM